MEKPLDSDLLDFILNSYRSSASDNVPAEEKEETEEKLYVALKKRDLDFLEGLVDEQERKHGLDLSNIRGYVEAMQDDDLIEERGDEIEEQSMNEGLKQALTSRIKTSSSEEMLVYLDEPIGIGDLFEVSEEIYEKHGRKAFFISDQVQKDGRVSVEITENATKFEMMKVYFDEETGFSYRHFGESKPGGGESIEDIHTESFFVYKFVSDNQEYLLFSADKLDPQRVTVHGTLYKVADSKQIGENRKIPINQDIIFVHSVDPLIESMSRERFNELKPEIDHEWLASHLLGEFRHPEWFEKLLLSMLMVGEDFGYPSPLIWLGEGGTGKSAALEAINTSMGESKNIHTGSGGTIKGLIPSFKETPPDEGYLLETQRVACVDEVFNIFASELRNSGGNIRDTFRPLLDLIEHQSRTFESGNGSIRGKMESQMIAATNPSYGIETMVEAAEKLDKAFLSRFILYEQTEGHVSHVDRNKARAKQLKSQGHDLLPEESPEFISLMDMLRNEVRVEVDFERIASMVTELKEKVPSEMDRVFQARYDDHMANVVAGLAKYNTMVEGRGDFEVRETDYEEMKTLFEIIIGSWHRESAMENLSNRAKVQYLRHNERRVYEYVSDNPNCTREKIRERFDDVEGLDWVLTELSRYGVVEKLDDEDPVRYRPFWFEETDKIGGVIE